MERRYCDICGIPIEPNVIAFIHWGYLYCPACEVVHRKNQVEESKVRNKWGV